MTPPLKPSALRVLRALQQADARGATTRQLGQAKVGGFRFSARIHELRAAGYTIIERYERPGSHRYRLVVAQREAA